MAWLQKWIFRTLLMVSFLLCARVHGEQRKWTILTGSEAEALTHHCSRAFPTGLTGKWTPASRDIELAEAKLAQAIDDAFKERKSRGQPAWRPPGYRRQYSGFYRDGRQVLYVNAVIDRGPDDWRKHAAKMCDGGTMAFGAVFDLNRQRFDSFIFNGDG